jgi:hypothetical protein
MPGNNKADMGRGLSDHTCVRGYWQPTKKMRELGFKLIRCGVDRPSAWAAAHKWNQRWRAVRRGERPLEKETSTEDTEHYPDSSIGAAFRTFRQSDAWSSKKPRTREDYWRAWKHIKPIFGDLNPNAITFQEFDWFYADLKEDQRGRTLPNSEMLASVVDRIRGDEASRP